MSSVGTPSRPYVPPMAPTLDHEGAGRSSRRHAPGGEVEMAREYERQLQSRDDHASKAESRRRIEREAEALLQREAERQSTGYAGSTSAGSDRQSNAWTDERLEQAERERDEWTRALAAKKAAMQQRGGYMPPADRGKTILVMTVDIGDGRQGTIDVHARDKPRDLAAAFCDEHDLADTVIDPLTEHIRNNIDALAPAKPSRPPPRPATSSKGRKRADKKPPTKKKNSSAANKKGYGYDIKAGERDEYLRRMSTEYPRVLEERLEQLREKADEEYRSRHTLKPKIDSKSRKIASKSRRKGSVFDRLHNDGVRRAKEREEAALLDMDKDKDEVESGRIGMSWVSREITKTIDPTQQGYTNYGEKLYNEGLAAMEQKRKNAEAKKLKEELNPDPELTFQPKISKRARQLQRSHDERLLDSLGDLKWLQKKKLQAEAEERLMEECTFQPRLNRITQKLVQTHVEEAGDAYTNRYDALYQDAMRRQSRQTEYSEWLTQEHTFHPDIGINRHYPTKDTTEEDFVTRLAYGKQSRDSLMRDVREAESTQENNDPGDRPFHPRTGRAPSGRAEQKGSQHIGDYLHKTAVEYHKMRRHLEDEAKKEQEELANSKKITHASDRIARRTMHQRLGEIFDELDTDRDGRIQPQQTDCELLDPTARKELVPIIKSCRQHFLTKGEFVRHVSARLRESHVGPRPWLFTHPKGSKNSKRRSMATEAKPDDAELTFHPRIDSKSEALAEHRSSIPVVDRLHAHLDLYTANKQMLYEQQLEGELAECTFTPQIDEVSAAMQARSAMDTKLEDRLSRKSLRPDGHQLTTEERILEEECTFQPNLSPTRRRNQHANSRTSHGRTSLLQGDSTAHSIGQIGSAQPVSINRSALPPKKPILNDWTPRPLSEEEDEY